jgi:hypothetical protein
MLYVYFKKYDIDEFFSHFLPPPFLIFFFFCGGCYGIFGFVIHCTNKSKGFCDFTAFLAKEATDVHPCKIAGTNKHLRTTTEVMSVERRGLSSISKNGRIVVN